MLWDFPLIELLVTMAASALLGLIVRWLTMVREALAP